MGANGSRRDVGASSARRAWALALVLTIGQGVTGCSSSSKAATATPGATTTTVAGASSGSTDATTVAGAADPTGGGGDYDKAAFCAAAKEIDAADTAMSDAANQSSLQTFFDKRIAALQLLEKNSPKNVKAAVKIAVAASIKLRVVLAKHNFDMAQTLGDPDAIKALGDGALDKAATAVAAVQAANCTGA